MRNDVLAKGQSPSIEEMALINRLTTRQLNPEEVYTFSVVLCDNEIDRDLERFSVDTLYGLKELFVGKTGIFDHSMSGRDQVARIYSCEVEKVEGVVTKAGEPYFRLKAKAYLPRIPKNEALIKELETGIKKEVSVGCAVERILCSVCGADWKSEPCGHIKGRYYQKEGRRELCHGVLKGAQDAYEWSFVAVPAQRNAGVVKSYKFKKEAVDLEIDAVLKALGSGGEVVLSNSEAGNLKRHIEELSRLAEDGRAYAAELRKQVLRLYSQIQPSLSPAVLQQVTEKMTVEELKAFVQAGRQTLDGRINLTPQLAAKDKKENGNSDFLI